jgi:uncharacterized protein (TIGR00369 family)
VTDGPGAQDELAAWFRRHWSDEIPFNRHTGMVVREWGPDAVEIELPFDDALSAHEGIFHGGMVAALIDTTGTGSVMAGHDFRKGSRVSTVSLNVGYLAAVPFESVVARAQAVHRGGRLHHAEVTVRSASGTVIARGSVVVTISGRRTGAPELPT